MEEDACRTTCFSQCFLVSLPFVVGTAESVIRLVLCSVSRLESGFATRVELQPPLTLSTTSSGLCLCFDWSFSLFELDWFLQLFIEFVLSSFVHWQVVCYPLHSSLGFADFLFLLSAFGYCFVSFPVFFFGGGRSRNRVVRLHPNSPLGDTILECYNCGEHNVFLLGFIPAQEENIVMLLCRTCLSQSSVQELGWDTSIWEPIIQDRSFLPWLVHIPGDREVERSLQITTQQIVKLEVLSFFLCG